MKQTLSRRHILTATASVGALAVTTPFSSSGHAQPGPDKNSLSQVRTLTEPGRWDSYSREQDTNLDIVQATNFTLSQASVATSNDLSVVCDILIVDGLIKLKGKNVSLVARAVICRSGAAIDTSGDPGTASLARAEDGRTPGVVGSDGAPGQAGIKSGNILIACGHIEGGLMLRANGGNGAKGQQGGTGAVGVTGKVGTPASKRSPPGNGFPGLPGGNGGTGGNGGLGGDAGQITILAVSQPPAGLSTEAKAGLGGLNGDPGLGGKTGSGGAPGNSHYDSPPRGNITNENYDPGGDTWYPTEAQLGPNLNQVSPSGLPNAYVATGGAAHVPELRAAEIVEVASYIPITQLKMTLATAYVSFANRDFEDLDKRLEWIKGVALAANCGSKYYEARSVRAGSSSVGQPAESELDTIGARASTFLQRMSLGLDVFGHTATWVSSLSSSYIQDATDERFRIATAVEAAYEDYLSKLTDTKSALSALNTSLALVEGTQDQLIKDKTQYEFEANQAQDQIQILDTSVSALSSKLEGADYKFKNAVMNLGHCDLLQMIEFVAGVIAICYGVYAGVAAVGDAINKSNTTAGSGGVIKDLEILYNTFDKSKALTYYKEMQEGYKKVQEALKDKQTKIVVSLEAFESQLKPYLELEEAKQYRDLMRQLADVARARNDKLLSYTQFVMKSAEAGVQSTSLGLEKGRITELVAQTNNPALVDCVSYMAEHLSQSKQSLVELLDLQRRSMTYVTLVPITPKYNLTRVIDLQSSNLAMKQSMLKAFEKRGRAEQILEAQFTIRRSTNSVFFRSLEMNNEAAFSIPLNDPEFNRGGTAFVTVFEVSLNTDGFTSKSGILTCRLTHQGNSLLRDADGNLLNFSHRKRPTNMSFRRQGSAWASIYETHNNLGGSDQYLYLSPFAGWVISFSPIDKVDYSRLKSVILSFKVKTIPTNVVDFSTEISSFLH